MEAKDRYLAPLLAGYPHGKYEARAKEYLDRIEMAEAEKQLKLHAKRGKPDTEAERLYADAQRYEEFGDALTAYEKYKSIPEIVAAEGKDRPFVLLAQKRAKELVNESEPSHARLALIQARLDDADKLEQEGERMKARKIWSSIVTLYGDNRELQPLVDRAQQALSGEEKPAPKAGDDAPQASPSPQAGPRT
ncbi:MAG: hypothetical protein B7Z73_16215 [Planctomycetia bacterium 21-64-5]|nr:MAG: hypothetical protein B7Z73_16215 [Planctomycetia bacterium 21-64-5]